jgi:hypothetical protein
MMLGAAPEAQPPAAAFGPGGLFHAWETAMPGTIARHMAGLARIAALWLAAFMCVIAAACTAAIFFIPEKARAEGSAKAVLPEPRGWKDGGAGEAFHLALEQAGFHRDPVVTFVTFVNFGGPHRGLAIRAAGSAGGGLLRAQAFDLPRLKSIFSILYFCLL